MKVCSLSTQVTVCLFKISCRYCVPSKNCNPYFYREFIRELSRDLKQKPKQSLSGSGKQNCNQAGKANNNILSLLGSLSKQSSFQGPKLGSFARHSTLQGSKQGSLSHHASLQGSNQSLNALMNQNNFKRDDTFISIDDDKEESKQGSVSHPSSLQGSRHSLHTSNRP